MQIVLYNKANEKGYADLWMNGTGPVVGNEITRNTGISFNPDALLKGIENITMAEVKQVVK